MQPVAFPFLLSQNESGTTRGKMKGDEKTEEKKKQERNKKEKTMIKDKWKSEKEKTNPFK